MLIVVVAHQFLCFLVRVRAPPRSTRPDALFPCPPLFRSVAAASDAGAASPAGASLAMAAESAVAAAAGSGATPASATGSAGPDFWQPASRAARDRKSTRLNSSH